MYNNENKKDDITNCFVLFTNRAFLVLFLTTIISFSFKNRLYKKNTKGMIYITLYAITEVYAPLSPLNIGKLASIPIILIASNLNKFVSIQNIIKKIVVTNSIIILFFINLDFTISHLNYVRNYP